MKVKVKTINRKSGEVVAHLNHQDGVKMDVIAKSGIIHVGQFTPDVIVHNNISILYGDVCDVLNELHKNGQSINNA